MKYTVGVKPAKLAVGIAGLTGGASLLSGVTALAVRGALSANPTDVVALMFGISALFCALSVWQIRRSVRPLIKVDGQRAVYYPARGKKRVVDISAVNMRRTTPIPGSTMPPVGIVGYAATGGTGRPAYEYVYFIDGKEVMRCSDEMRNARKLDAMIRTLLPQTED